jgi:putative flippase GtrA
MISAPQAGLVGKPRPATIAYRYVLFAVIAGAMNLGAQAITFALAPAYPLALSIVVGTAVGFVVKYLLDKKYIFFDDYSGAGAEARKVVLYGSFSVAMTLVFWAFEIGFFAIWGTDAAKFSGAVIGLAIGNYAKYLLDRTFTFGSNGGVEKAQAWN